MTQTALTGSLLTLFLPLAASAALAHEDDPKILGLQPAFSGQTGYSAAKHAAGDRSQAGTLAAFGSGGVTLLAQLPLSTFQSGGNGNDCWGYTSPSGREYAIFGHSNGTSFVEITSPGAPVVVATMAGPNSLWRDIKTYDDRAYAVSEGGQGIQVFDLSDIDNGNVVFIDSVTLGPGGTASHNVAIDETSGYLYRCGGGSSGIRIYDLSTPLPSFVGEWSDRYVHDAQVHTYTSGPHAGKQIAFCFSGFSGGFSQTGLSIIDVTNKANPQHIGQTTWPGASYSHQGWLSADGTKLFVDDEQDEPPAPTTTYVIDVANLNDPQYLGSFTNGSTAVGHNLYVKGNQCFEANYTSGLRVFDVTSPLAAVETNWYDTYPSNDGASYNGLWSCYPYFDSGVVIGSDMQSGLFVWWVGTPPITFTPKTVPEFADSAGGTVITVTIAEDTPGDLLLGTETFHYDDGSGPVSVPLVPLGGGDYEATLPALPCGAFVQYWFSAQSQTGVDWVDPSDGSFYEINAAQAQNDVFVDDVETDKGWSVGLLSDTASAGLWVRGDPVGTAAQPEDDHTPGGTDCFFTGQGSDVNGGVTTLVTPVLDLTGYVEPTIGYWRWFSNDTGSNPGTDVLRVGITEDGVNWVSVEVVGNNGDGTGGWVYNELRVADLVDPTATVQVRFVASDFAGGSVVEAAVDDFEVKENVCADCDGNQTSDDLDLLNGDLLDLNGDGTPDSCQPLSADVGTISTSTGGTQSFTLDAGATYAGDLYVLLGTTSGTSPGTPFGSILIPLNSDAWTTVTLASPNLPPLVNTFNVLDGAGQGTAALTFPSPIPSLLGVQANHAYVVVDVGTAQVLFASNAIPVDFTL